jgi:hypothetical protein
MIVNTKQAIDHITLAIRARLVAMLHGDPGIGKSAIVQALADKFKLKLIDIRLSQVDPTELNGFASIQGDIAKYIPMNTFPLADAPLPKDADGKPMNGWLLFLDELPSAPLSVQAASFKLTLDRQVGQHDLHKNVAIICAGNLSTNGAIVNRISTPMQSRLVHFELATDVEAWTEWASKNKLDFRVISFVHNLPDKLHAFDPNHSDKTFACPRTWEFVSKILTVAGSTPLRDLLPLIAGTIGEGAAREFIMYTETLSEMATIDEILRDPLNAKLKDEPSLLYAASHLVATHAKKANIDTLMKFVSRMPFEFETITLQNILRREESLKDEPVIQDWIVEKGEALL